MTRDQIISDHMAAAILMEARLRGHSYGEKTALQLNTNDLGNLIFSHFEDLTYADAHLENAMQTLRECGLAKSSREPFEERFHRIEFSSLPKALAVAHKEGAKILKALENMRLDDADLGNFPTYRAFNEHRLIERYHDFGDQWLRAQISNLMFDLASWDEKNGATGKGEMATEGNNNPTRLTIDEGMRERIVDEVAKIHVAIEGTSVGNVEKAQARALLRAIEALADAPEPPGDLIWELLQRANNISGIASLFVSIIALFTAAQ